MMKKYLFLCAFTSLFATMLLVGCDDGYYGSKPYWAVGGNGSLSEDESAISLECVSVVDYKEFTYETSSSDTTHGDVTRNDTTLPATSAMGGMNLVTYENPIRKCIETEIQKIKGNGSSFYWGKRTWVITREKISRKPATESVTFANFIDCKQIQAAACLLIN